MSTYIERDIYIYKHYILYSVHISCEYIYTSTCAHGRPPLGSMSCPSWALSSWECCSKEFAEISSGNVCLTSLMWASCLWVPFIDSFLLGASIWHFGVWRTNFSLWAAILIASNMDMVLQQNNVQKNPCNDICWQDWCLGKRRKKTWSGTLTHTPFSEVA